MNRFVYVFGTPTGPGNIGQIKRAAADLDRSEQTIRAYASGRHKSRPGKPVNIPPDVRAKMAELEHARVGYSSGSTIRNT